MTLKRIFGIVSDIDGVLVRGSDPIKNVKQTIQNLQKPMSVLFQNQLYKNQDFIPFVCLTNGGGMLEHEKAKQISKYLDLDKPLNQNDFLLNFSALRPIMRDHAQKVVLIDGKGDIEQISQDSQMMKYITVNEYYQIYQHEKSRCLDSKIIQLQNELQERIGVPNITFNRENKSKNYVKIDAVMILNDPLFWEKGFEIIPQICDPKLGSQIPIYTVNSDFTYADKFCLPRLAYGPFTECLKRIFKEKYDKELQIQRYGKPHTKTHLYAKKFLETKTKNTIDKLYMIGDNPKSDIRGANKLGWTSILVKTGVFQGSTNDLNDPATHVVEDFSSAIKLIMSLENLQTKYF